MSVYITYTHIAIALEKLKFKSIHKQLEKMQTIFRPILELGTASHYVHQATCAIIVQFEAFKYKTIRAKTRCDNLEGVHIPIFVPNLLKTHMGTRNPSGRTEYMNMPPRRYRASFGSENCSYSIITDGVFLHIRLFKYINYY